MVKVIKNKLNISTNPKELSKKIIKEIEAGSEIRWTSELSIHESNVDAQHKTLLAKINEVVKNSETNDLGFIRLESFLLQFCSENQTLG